tara:strand:+ start:1568 stop:2365 length:798 start_codon:yes stop_codon:yes gene_type:complete
MNVLCILTAWNEMEYLPFKVEYCRQNELDLYVIDHMSDDGSWEWLQENDISSHRFDNGGIYDLSSLQGEILRTVHRLKPDWVIYNGCDLFPITLIPLAQYLENLDSQGFSGAQIDFINFFNTGEQPSNDPFSTYFYYAASALTTKLSDTPQSFKRLTMIHKYNPLVVYNGDDVFFPGIKVTEVEGVMVNYGGTKSVSQRNATLQRRQKAWHAGTTPIGHGIHYAYSKEKNWKWSKNELYDVRVSKYWPYIHKISEVSACLTKDTL